MIETLGEHVLKSNETMIVKHSTTLNLNPAYTFFLRQTAELMDNGFAARTTHWSDKDCGIIWGEIYEEIVGIFAYNKEHCDHELLEILLTSVDLKHRRKGIHTILNSYFESLALSFNCKITAATISPKNEVRLASAKKDGYSLIYYKMYKLIEK